jgi:hypothetical protein
MLNPRKRFSAFCIILIMIAIFVHFGGATPVSLVVKPGEEITHDVGLILEDRVLIQINAIGEGTSNLVQFSLGFPNGTIKDFGEVSSFHTSFVCDLEGNYTLNFANKDQTESKRVTLNYEIEHYVFGMPQMFFMVILIAFISVVGVAVFIGLSQKP